MLTRRQFTYTLTGTTVSAATPLAQSGKPDFSGAWDLDLDRTEGPFTPPALIQVIDHQDPVFKWTTKFKDGGTPKIPQYLTYLAVPSGELKTDGHYETVKVAGGEREMRTLWNASRLVTTWAVRTLHDPSQGKWQRALSADGKSQTLDLEFKSAMLGAVQATLVFRKIAA